MSVTVTAIDDRVEDGAWYFVPRYAGPIGSASRILDDNVVSMTSVTSMVDNVIQVADGHAISWLNIIDHGSAYGIQIGDDRIYMITLSNFAAELGRLRPYFALGATVHLQHCEAGQNQELMMALANIWNVTVRAGKGFHNALLRINYSLDPYVLCDATHCWDEPPPNQNEPLDWKRKACCFPADTPVHSDTGLKPIQSIRKGDKVLALDAARGGFRATPVREVEVHTGAYPLTELGIGKDGLRVTAGHRFATVNRPWTPTEFLNVGEDLLCRGQRVPLRSSASAGATRRVYNLKMEYFSNYLVGAAGVIARDF